MFWALLGLIFIASFVLVVRAIRVATIDERLDMREIKLMKNLSRYARRYSTDKRNSTQKWVKRGKSGAITFPPVSDWGSFTAS